MNLRFFLYGMGFVLVALLGTLVTLSLNNKKTAETAVLKINATSITIIDEQGKESPLLSGNTPVMVNIWATWCNPCIAEMPLLATVAQKMQGKIKVVLLTDESIEKITTFRKSHPDLRVDFYKLKDVKLKDLGISSYPTTFLLTPKGGVLWTLSGQIKTSEEEFIKLIEDKLKE